MNKRTLTINPPPYVFGSEFYNLFYFMVTGIPRRAETSYLVKKHCYIHMGISDIWKMGGKYVGSCQLINYLNESHLLELAGGENYIKRIFGDFDLLRDTTLNQWER